MSFDARCRHVTGFKPPPESLDSLLNRSANGDDADDDDDDDDIWDTFAVSRAAPD